MSASSTWVTPSDERRSGWSPAPPSPTASAGNRTRHGKKVRLENRLQHHLRRRLRHPVTHRRNPQRPLTAIWFRDVHAPHRRGTIRPAQSHDCKLRQQAVDAVLLHRRPASTRSTPAAPRFAAPAPTPPTGRHPCRYGHTGRGNASPADCLAAAHSRRCSSRTFTGDGPPVDGYDRLMAAGVVGPGFPAMPSRLPAPLGMTKVRGPSLPARYVARRSPVLRPPRTPAALQPTSPSAYTTGLCPTQAGQTGLSCSAPTCDARAAARTPERPDGYPGTGPAGHGLRRDMSGSALPIVTLTRLQRSLHAAARALAPSKEALDTPLSPPTSPRRTGACYPALRRLPGRDSHPLACHSFQDAPCAKV